MDGVALRNVSKNSTADPLDSSVFHYPQTPARIQFSCAPLVLPRDAPRADAIAPRSIWAPGREEQPEGLVDFAGGAVDWNSSIYSEQGYYASYGGSHSNPQEIDRQLTFPRTSRYSLGRQRRLLRPGAPSRLLTGPERARIVQLVGRLERLGTGCGDPPRRLVFLDRGDRVGDALVDPAWRNRRGHLHVGHFGHRSGVVDACLQASPPPPAI